MQERAAGRARLREGVRGSQWRVGTPGSRGGGGGRGGAASVSHLPPVSLPLALAWSCDRASCIQVPGVAAGCTRDRAAVSL